MIDNTEWAAFCGRALGMISANSDLMSITHRDLVVFLSDSGDMACASSAEEDGCHA